VTAACMLSILSREKYARGIHSAPVSSHMSWPFQYYMDDDNNNIFETLIVINVAYIIEG
jgi:hypothetical protein